MDFSNEKEYQLLKENYLKKKDPYSSKLNIIIDSLITTIDGILEQFLQYDKIFHQMIKNSHFQDKSDIQRMFTDLNDKGKQKILKTASIRIDILNEFLLNTNETSLRTLENVTLQTLSDIRRDVKVVRYRSEYRLKKEP